jgi:hypothetical protein
MRIIPVALLLALLATASVACQEPRDTIDVFYIENSYVYFNNLPELVEGISTGLDGPILRGTAHTHGGATLRRHLDDNHLPEILSEGAADGDPWDWVFLHEQSTLGTGMDVESGALGSPDAFHEATRELVGMIRGEAAKPALYMTWAKEAFPLQTETLSHAYRSIGLELGVPVAGVGEAWAEVRRVNPEFNLHVSDGSHPNAAGSYLAACVIYAMVTGQSPLGAPREITGTPWNFAGPVESSQPTILVSLTASDAEFLQSVAWQAVSAHAAGEG